MCKRDYVVFGRRYWPHRRRLTPGNIDTDDKSSRRRCWRDSVGSCLVTLTTMTSFFATDVDSDNVRSQQRSMTRKVTSPLSWNINDGDVNTLLRSRRWWSQHSGADVYDEIVSPHRDVDDGEVNTRVLTFTTRKSVLTEMLTMRTVSSRLRGQQQEGQFSAENIYDNDVSIRLRTSATMTSTLGEEVSEDVKKCLTLALGGDVSNERVSSHLSS